MGKESPYLGVKKEFLVRNSFHKSNQTPNVVPWRSVGCTTGASTLVIPRETSHPSYVARV